MGNVRMSFQVDGILKDFIKGTATFDDLFSEFTVVAKKIAKSGFSDASMTFPQVWTYKDVIKLQLDHPFAQNMAVVTVHGGEFNTVNSKIIYPNKKKVALTTANLVSGALFETPLALVMNAFIQREYAKLRKAAQYSQLDSIGKQKMDTQMADLEEEIDSMRTMPAQSFIFPENIIAVSDGNIYINSFISTPWVDGLSNVATGDINSEVIALVDDFMNITIDAYKGIFGLNKTIEEIQADLHDVGVKVDVSNDTWIKVPDVNYFTGSISTHLAEYMASHKSQVIALFPYFLRNTYYGFEMTDSELGSALYDYGRVLNKLFGARDKTSPANMLTDKYEIMTAIRKAQDLDTTPTDLTNFEYYHALRRGDIVLEVADDIIPTYEELKILKQAIADLRNPIFELPDAEQTKYTYKASQRLIGVTMPDDSVVNLKAVGRNWIAGAEGAIKAIMSPDTRVGYELMELFEQIQNIYFACIDPNLSGSDIVKTEQGLYKFKVSNLALSQQLHYAFVGANPVFILAKA